MGSPALRIFDSTERSTTPCSALLLLDAAAIEELDGYEDPLMLMEVISMMDGNRRLRPERGMLAQHWQ